KVLDQITAMGGEFEIVSVDIGHSRHDPSYAQLRVHAPSRDLLETILTKIGEHGAVPILQQDCQLEAADMDGAFPEGFYCTTNQQTEVRLEGEWLPVRDQEMDCGIVVDRAGRTARCVPMSDVVRGQDVVMGR